jgi:hypothetical protein
MRSIEQRVLKLEREVSAAAMRFVWADTSETAEQALARQLPDGPPGNCQVVVFKFGEQQTVKQAECDGPSDDLCLLPQAGRA